jgi:glutamate synthase (NADPH/NADH)
MGRVSFAESVENTIIEEHEPVNIYPYENTPQNKSWAGALPVKQGLYDPELEKDACGVGFAA